MNHPFDPYHQWLGIRDSQRPPNLYRLLGIDLFESDAEVIETAADRQMAHLRTYQHGPHAELSQQLLNEVSAAKVCLLDAARKSRYDERLQRQGVLPIGPPAIAGELAEDQTAESVVVQGQHVALRPPGRGPRGERPWYVSMMFLVPLLVIVALLAAYRIYRDYLRSPGPVANVPAEMASTPTETRPSGNALPAQTESPAQAESLTQESSTDDLAKTETAGETAMPPPEAPSAATTDSTEARESAAVPATSDDTPAAQAHGGPPGNASDESSATAQPAAAPPRSTAAWDPAAGAVSGEPPRFSTRQPMGPFLLGLAQRDPVAADSALQALRMHRALGIPDEQFQQAELLRETLDQFWSAADASLETLAVGETLALGESQVTVTQRNHSSLTVQMPDGQQQEFELARAKLQGELAIGLVRRHHAASPPIAWRLIATFLAVDHQGDAARAAHWAWHAELQGFAATFLTDIVRSLGGESYASQIGSENDSASLPLESTVANATPEPIGDVPSESHALPDASQQQQARREVLSPLYAELRQQEIPPDQWARHLLQRAGGDDLDPAARYILLDSALKRARARRDIDTALAAIDALARDFQQSRADLRYDLLQSLSRRLRGDERRRYAELAQQMARDAISENDYDEAIRFASLAQSLGRSVADRAFRRYLLDFRLEIDAIREAYQTLQSSNTEANEAGLPDPVEQARFRVLAQGDFQSVLSDLQATDDEALRAVVEQELTQPQSPPQQLELARTWLQLSEQLTGIERVNAQRRAHHWYLLCQPNLSRVQRGEVRQHLDAIARAVGRKSDRLDLTTEPPVVATVGIGTFGVNQNPDIASNSQIQPLPQVADDPITRFLWACAPSRVEYLVPEGARQFTAIGLVNAPTRDGVRFVVKANGQDLYKKVVLEAMGRCEIDVKLPEHTETLELIVEPVGSIVLDHTYWINPALTF